MKHYPSRFSLVMLVACLMALWPAGARADYFSFFNSNNDIRGSDTIMLEARWPYWNSSYFNTWFEDYFLETNGPYQSFYDGMALPPKNSPDPVTTPAGLNWSFWGISYPYHIDDNVSSVYNSPTTFSLDTIAEGTIFRAPGKWAGWRTNVWYRMVERTWLPVDGTPHQGFAGIWFRDGYSGVWHHRGTVQLPYAVSGFDAQSGFQECAGPSGSPQRTDYRNCYYHRGGVWGAADRFQVSNWTTAVENAGLIDNNTAAYYETAYNDPDYVGISNRLNSPIYILTNQPAQPIFDPIVVTGTAASRAGNQLLVQWQMPDTSSPQFAYQIKVYTNASYTGTIVGNAYAIEPEVRQQLLTLTNSGAATVYPRLTIIDLFDQTNPPIDVTVTTATLQAATSVPNAVSGLNFTYYQSASNYTLDTQTNWITLPNFAALTPVFYPGRSADST